MNEEYTQIDALCLALTDNRYIANKVVTSNAGDTYPVLPETLSAWIAAVDAMATSGYMATIGTRETVNDPNNARRAYYRTKFNDALHEAARLTGLDYADITCNGLANRVAAATFRLKTYKSEAMIEAENDLKEAKKSLNDYEALLPEFPELSQMLVLDGLKVTVAKKQATVAQLASESHNKWRDPVANLTANGCSASTACRKAIEDAFADCINMRAFLSVDEIHEAYETKKAARKAREKERRRQKAAEKNAVNRPTEASATK